MLWDRILPTVDLPSGLQSVLPHPAAASSTTFTGRSKAWVVLSTRRRHQEQTRSRKPPSARPSAAAARRLECGRGRNSDVSRPHF